ncbi:cytochrome p450 [Plakobranchus ocellatus]|uniref:Cytochrome p450 n=1 Tax=Plakobranchus ocellatus TaxID=259542 RepID=A0AAV3YKP1_9GAST|nr:cytochrome p450 [Plakobranchus ocellatus]
MVFSYLLGFEPSFLLLVTIFLVILFIVTSWTHIPDNAPPSPARAYPVLGHLPHLTADPRGTMLEWRRKTGDIYSIYMGLTLTVVISSYDLLKETIVKKAEFFSSKPHTGSIDVMACDKGIISTSGPPWKENRAAILSILRSFGMGKNVMGEKIMEEVSAYLKELGHLEGRPADVKGPTFRTVANVVCNFLLGKRFEYTDTDFDKFMDLTERIIEQLGGNFLHNVFPWVKYLPGDLFKAKRMIRCADQYLEFADAFIEKVQKEEIVGDNVISAYLEEMQKQKDAGQPSELSLGQHPQVYEEIVREIGTERPPEAADKTRLNFLCATIMEVQRIASIVPVGLPHRCTEDIPIRNYVIPKDAIILMHLDAVLLDENLWGDPWNFRPDRFLNDKGELFSPEQFVVFSMGKRVCLGEGLAKMELFLLLASVLQRFEVLPGDTNAKLPPLKDKNGIACPPEPFMMRLAERQQH